MANVQNITLRQWPNMSAYPIAFASLDHLRAVDLHRAAIQLVWPGEGAFDDFGAWRFDENHRKLEPLLLSVGTASQLMSMYNALDSDGRERFVRLLTQDRNGYNHLLKFDRG